MLGRHFARDAGQRNGREIKSLASDVEDALRVHRWPGNVRELRNVMERAVIMGNGPVLGSNDVNFGTAVASPIEESNGSDDLVGRLMASEITFEDFEKSLLKRALERTHGNQSRAARMLGMTRRTLQYRIDKFDIDTAAMRR